MKEKEDKQNEFGERKEERGEEEQEGVEMHSSDPQHDS